MALSNGRFSLSCGDSRPRHCFIDANVPKSFIDANVPKNQRFPLRCVRERKKKIAARLFRRRREIHVAR